MCLYPKLIKNRKYTSNKKNKGVIPLVKDDRVLYVPVGCGQCMECRKMKARQWKVRLSEDIKRNKNAKFVTLTFNDESIAKIAKEIKYLSGYELDNEIAKKALRWFLERYRKKYKKSLRHWLVTELGHNGTENIHLHGIIWTEIDLKEIEKIWSYGWMWKGKEENGKTTNYVSEKTVNYIVKYVTKIDEKHKTYKSRILTSPGIGKGYENSWNATQNRYREDKTDESYRMSNGFKTGLPIYYRNKIYSEEERERLWLNKLDKQERWVGGERVSIAENEIEYEKLRDYYRRVSKEMGYGDDTKNWERVEYERMQRIINQKTRIAKGLKKAEKLAKPLAGGQ